MKVDLSQFTHKDAKHFSSPFTVIDRESHLWSCACDRAMFVAYRARSKFPRWKGPGELLSQMLEWLHGAPDSPVTIQTEELLQWIGPAPKLGKLLGVVIDQERFGKILRAAPKPEVLLWKGTRLVQDERCIVVGLEGRWRALLMGHDEPKLSEEEKASLTVFDIRGEGASVFDLAMSLDEG